MKTVTGGDAEHALLPTARSAGPLSYYTCLPIWLWWWEEARVP